MPIPFLNSIKLNKNQVEDFCVFNYSGDPTLSSGADFGYLWLNTSATPKVLKFWDGTNYRTLIDSTTISSSTAGTANDLSGGVAGSLPYQQAAGDTTFLGIGTADQVLTVNSGATAPQWLSQSSLSVGSSTNIVGGSLGAIAVQTGVSSTNFLNVGTAGQVITSNGVSPQYVNQSTLSVGSATTATTATNVAGGANGSILVQSGAGTTGQLAIGANGYILTSNGTTPGWSATIPSTSVSGLAASATTDTTNASNISSGTLGLARLSLASGQFYVGDGSNNPAATAKSSIPLSGFGAAGADVAMGGYKITGLADPAAATDAATRGYVDSVAQGLDVKASCLVATTADITLASPGAVTIDGVYSATDFTSGTTRILVKDQSAPAENGIYIWQGPSSAMTRSADANTWDELVGAFTFIERGTANADSGWVCTVNAGGTLGSTAVTWVKFSQAGSYTAGNGIVQSGTSFNFAQSSAYTAGQIPFASSTTAMGFSANLNWDNANNSLGIGTATPAATLDVRASNGVGAVFLRTTNPAAAVASAYIQAPVSTGFSSTVPIYGFWYQNSGLGNPASDAVSLITGSTERFKIVSDGVCTWSNVGGNSGTAMTLNGTGLGIGATPNYPLTVNGTIRLSGGNGTKVTWASDASSQFIQYSTAIDGLIVDGYDTVQLQTRATPRVTVNSSGNVGIGTTTPTNRLNLVAANSSGFNISFDATGNARTGLFAWTYGSSSAAIGGGVEYTASDTFTARSTLASFIQFSSGNCTWFGNSGLTSGNTFSPSQLMVLNSSGNLGLGVTPSAWTLPAFQSAYGVYSGTSEFNTSANAYYDGQWKHISNAPATRYSHAAGVHYWFTKAAGTGVITWTQAMTLDASGNLGIGATTILNRAQIQGAGQATNTVNDNGDGSALFLADTGAAGNNGGMLLMGASVVQGHRPQVGIKSLLNDGTAYGTGDMAFLTRTTTASTTLTEKMRLTTAGFLGVGMTPVAPLSVRNSSGGFVLNFERASGAKLRGEFDTDAAGTGVVLYSVNSAANAYQPLRLDASVIRLKPNGVEALTVKTNGQTRFVPLASAPASPERGDVYYDSTTERLRYYNNTAWVDSGTRKYVVQLSDGSVTVAGNAYTLTHNFGTQNVTVSIRRTTDNAVVQADVVMPAGGNTVTVTFAAAITAANYYVTVIG